jgi:glycosyltransferase involved in cell wall biosynthesis
MVRLSSGSSGPPLRVALAAVGDPRSPSTWSGVTAGVLGGMDELGVGVQPIDLALPRGLEQALLAAAAAPTRTRYDAEGAALTMRVRGVLARRALGAAHVDGVIQIGTSFLLPPRIPFVTLEDMTLRQASVGHPVFSRMSPRGIEGWERRRVEIYARARMCAVASSWAGESLLGDYGIPSDRLAVVGFGATHAATVPDREWTHPRFLFVGIDWERKGGPQVLRAFSHLRRVHPDATLDVVGGHPPLREPGVSAHGVLSRTNERDRAAILDLFARATCFVMPSLIEPFGIAYVEAASAGIASIATSVGGPRDVIGRDGGIVLAPDDQAALLDAMLRLADPDTARRMGRAARERSGIYTWVKVAERLLRALGLQAPDGRTLARFL